MAPEPVQVPSVPAITTNGTPPERPGPLATEAANPASPRKSPSPAALPPIQPPYPGKIAESLLAAPQRSISPGRQNTNVGLAEGTSDNPAAILTSQATGMTKAIDPPSSNAAPPAPGPKLPPIETGTVNRIPPTVPGAPAGIDSLTSPHSATSVSAESGLTATAGLGSDTSPTRPRLGSIPETLGPNYVGTATPSTPFSPPMEGRQSASYPDPRASVSSASGAKGRHTCPNCNQTFTRHHNLKSHLLTHSHEKPFQCMTCQSRFRRLHDLKRHQKLHTGERPHVCTSCGRRFARGDALARHLRGEGGCAGRRTSMSGLPEGAYNEGDMNIDNEDGDEPMPDYPESPTARKAMSLPTSRSRTSFSRVRAPRPQPPNLQPAPVPPREVVNHSYPPLNPNTPGFPAPGTASKNFPPSINTSQPSSNVPSILQQGNLTDSPRALSPSNPGFGIPPQDSTSLGPRARSPSYSGSFHQPGMERRPSTIEQPPGGYSLPQPNQTSPRSHNTPLPGSLSRPGSFSSTHLAPPDPMNSGQSNMFTAGDPAIWNYIKGLEKRIRELEDKNQVVESRLIALTTERQSSGPPMAPQAATTGQESG
ncbi:hypothetical protein ABW19_dt0204302 [Dactylella cylindrospora]|nr:hypothetical protein ABW19_dt0204302 [Dactylella cylindrospora]